MKIERFENGIRIIKRKYSLWNRLFLRFVLPYALIVNLLFIIISNFKYSFELIISLIICDLIITIFTIGVGLTEDIYYVYFVHIVSSKTIVKFYKKNQNKQIQFDFTFSNIKLEKRIYYRAPLKVITIRKDDDNYFEIWPDNSLIGKQWKQKDILELYDILIDYQNKLKEKLTSEQE